MKKILAVILAVAMVAAALFAFAACDGTGTTSKEYKVGVLREDDTSGEAIAWQGYLTAVGKELGLTFEFVTTDSSTSEVNAINTFAAKGFKAILLFSDDDVIASVTAANKNKMYLVIPTGNVNDEQREQLNKLEYYLGSVSPTDDTDYQAGYDMAKYFVNDLGKSVFTLFGGATCYAVSMHVQRLAGILAYLCEDEGTSYDGAKTRDELVGKVAGLGVDPAKFVSTKYTITGYMDGFAFDDAFSTKLQQSMIAGGTSILSVGAGDAVAGIAYGIANAVASIDASEVKSAGVDAITSAYADCFNIGYTYDCGKYASAMAPGLVLLTAALNGNKIVDETGAAPRAGMSYWVATSLDELNTMLAADNETDGYCYNGKVVEYYAGKGYTEFLELCNADFEAAKTINANYGK